MNELTPVQILRCKNLNKLLNERFGGVKADFARALNKDPNQVRFILHPEKAGGRRLGEKQAREIEEKIGLPAMYLDQEHDNGGLIKSAKEKAIRFLSVLPDEEIRNLLPLLESLTAKHKDNHAV